MYSCNGVDIESIEVYIIHSHEAFLNYYRTMIKRVENEKAYKIRLFVDFVFCEFDGKNG